MLRSGTFLGDTRHLEQFAHPLDESIGVVVAGVEQVRVGLVEPDPRARGFADPPGQTVVVGVEVGHDHALDVADRATRLLESEIQGLPGVVSGPPRVHNGHAAVEFECVDQHVAQWIIGNRDRNRPDAGANILDRRQHVAIPSLFLGNAGDGEHDAHGIGSTKTPSIRATSRRKSHPRGTETCAGSILGVCARRLILSGCGDLNPGPPAPKAGALPSCATSRGDALHPNYAPTR